MRTSDLPWILRLIWDPVATLDLVDKTGAPDHGKIMPVAVILAVLLFHLKNMPLPLSVIIVLISAAYGQSMWRTLLKAKAAGVYAENLPTNVPRTPAEERPDGTG